MHEAKSLYTSRHLVAVLLCLSFFFGTISEGQEKSSITEPILELIERDGIAAAVSRYHELASSDLYETGPSELNRLGYHLLSEGRIEEAVQILELNVRLHPAYTNGYDSLAEAHIWASDYASATATYHRLLEATAADSVTSPGLLDRLRSNARRALQTLAGESDDTPRSPRIAQLKEEIEAGASGAIERFREELIASGAPLIEQVSDQWLVTFVWFDSGQATNVAVESWLAGRSPEGREMIQLEGSDIWYRTYEAPPRLRMGYLISPDDRRLSPYSTIIPQSAMISTYRTDPLNPEKERGEMNLEWSIVSLPGAPNAPWLSDDAAHRPELEQLELALTEDERPWQISIQTPPGFSEGGDETYPLVIFFDAFGFREIDQADVLISKMIEEGRIPPLVAAYLYNPGRTRNRDMSCYEPTYELLERLTREMRLRYRAGLDPSITMIAGKSRSGLGAVCSAFHRPDLIGHATSLSGSFWWAPDGEEPELLARQFAESEKRPLTLHLLAGSLESEANPSTGLAMITVTRHLRDVARARGYEVIYEELPGAHDPTIWRTALPDILIELTSRSD